MAMRWSFAFALFVALSLGALAVGCSRTPRTGPPFKIGLANADLQKTSDCVLTGLKKSVPDPTITTSVKMIDPGKVEEITGTSADEGEIYVIRLTAENDGTKAEAFSVISWSKFKEGELQSALSHCVTKLENGLEGRGGFSADSKHATGNSLH
jgi:hypothetical protein